MLKILLSTQLHIPDSIYLRVNTITSKRVKWHQNENHVQPIVSIPVIICYSTSVLSTIMVRGILCIHSYLHHSFEVTQMYFRTQFISPSIVDNKVWKT